MIYVIAVLFPIVSILCGIAVSIAVLKFVRDILAEGRSVRLARAKRSINT